MTTPAETLSQKTPRSKRDFGLAENIEAGGIPQAVKPVVDLIVDEIQQSFNLYHNKYGQSLGRVILSGGAAKLPGLKEYFGQAFRADIFVGEPWGRIIIDPDMKVALTQTSSGYEVAVGLALKQIVNSDS